MNCDEAGQLLGAHADGEVDPLRSHALHKHLAGCVACGQRAQALRALKHQLNAELPRHDAPAALRERVAWGMRSAAPSTPPPERRWRWFGTGALAGALGTALLWLAGTAWQQTTLGDDLPTRLVALHTRATLGAQRVQVASSDQHTVKPWLSERLDYAIPVLDASGAGFPLRGARIDVLDGRPVAVLVYQHGQHWIDVHVRPLTAHAPSAGLHTVRGFNVAAAQGAQMSWLATSDLNAPALTAFVSRLAAGQVGTTGG